MAVFRCKVGGNSQQLVSQEAMNYKLAFVSQVMCFTDFTMGFITIKPPFGEYVFLSTTFSKSKFVFFLSGLCILEFGSQPQSETSKPHIVPYTWGFSS